jgi:hypothetical protein
VQTQQELSAAAVADADNSAQARLLRRKAQDNYEFSEGEELVLQARPELSACACCALCLHDYECNEGEELVLQACARLTIVRLEYCCCM